MDWQDQFYICPHCFHIADTDEVHHRRNMLHYPGFPAGHELLKPPRDRSGDLTARAPRWFLEREEPLRRRP